MLLKYSDYLVSKGMTQVEDLLRYNSLRLTPLARLLQSYVFKGAVADFALYQAADCDILNLAMSEAIGVPQVAYCPDFSKVMLQDMLAASSEFAVTEVHAAGVALVGADSDVVVKGAVHFNSPRIDLARYLSMAGYDKKKRYKINQIKSALNISLSVREANAMPVEDKILVLERCASSLLKRWTYSKYPDALLQVIYGICTEDALVASLWSDEELVATAIFTKDKDWLVFQSLVVHQPDLNNVGNLMLCHMLNYMAYISNTRWKGIDPTAETDPFVPSSSDTYKRLLVNESNTRYSFLAVADDSEYQEPVGLLTKNRWKGKPVFINGFDLPWIHDDKMQVENA